MTFRNMFCTNILYGSTRKLIPLTDGSFSLGYEYFVLDGISIVSCKSRLNYTTNGTI